jgi:hypothetical protein
LIVRPFDILFLSLKQTNVNRASGAIANRKRVNSDDDWLVEFREGEEDVPLGFCVGEVVGMGEGEGLVGAGEV